MTTVCLGTCADQDVAQPRRHWGSNPDSDTIICAAAPGTLPTEISRDLTQRRSKIGMAEASVRLRHASLQTCPPGGSIRGHARTSGLALHGRRGATMGYRWSSVSGIPSRGFCDRAFFASSGLAPLGSWGHFGKMSFSPEAFPPQGRKEGSKRSRPEEK